MASANLGDHDSLSGDSERDVTVDINEHSASQALALLREEHERVQAQLLALQTQLSAMNTVFSANDNTQQEDRNAVRLLPPAQTDRPVHHSEADGVVSSFLRKMLPQDFTGEMCDNPTRFFRDLQNAISTFNLSVAQTKSLLLGTLKLSASMWWREHADTFSTNEDILHGFRHEFISPQYVQSILTKIQGTKQIHDEDCRAFIDRVLRLYNALPDPRCTQEIIQQILISLHPYSALHLGGKSYNSLGELKAEASRFDAHMGDLQYLNNQQLQQRRERSPPNAPGDSRSKQYTEQRGRKTTCYRCGQDGHIRRNCPSKNGGRGGGSPAAPNF